MKSIVEQLTDFKLFHLETGIYIDVFRKHPDLDNKFILDKFEEILNKYKPEL
jgi:hypothetical protein